MLRNWIIFDKLPTEQLIRVKHIHVFEGGRSALYITSGDVVYGVGANGNYNLLGLSGRHRHFSLVLEPVSVERLSLKAITTIAVGEFFGVAKNMNGELYHWGRRMDKRRGILLPHLVKCPYFVTDLACGSEFFVILTREQKVFFRGTFQQNDHPILEFTEVSVGFNATAVSCGIFHAAMLTTDGEVYNCGYDHHATYRTWKAEDGLHPKKLDIREPCVQVVCGRRTTVCLLRSGSVWACGENDNLGVESENSVMKNPAKVRIPEPIRELAATWFSNLYAASAWNGRIYCWGNKAKWPTVVSDACVLLDSFKNRETPSSLGLVPVAPQLSPCSSFNSKKPLKRAVLAPLSYEVERRLERSLSADDLSSSRYPAVQKETADSNNNENHNQPENASKSTPTQFSKSNKNLPPGLGLLITAGKYLATRPSDRQTNVGVIPRRRAVSPEAHPAKSPTPRLSVANGTPTGSSVDMTRSQSMENLDSPPSPPTRKKPRVLSMIFSRNPFEVGRKTPTAIPENESPPQFYVEQQKPKSPESDVPSTPTGVPNSTNPFLSSNDVPLYPDIPMPVENGPAKYYVSSIARNEKETSRLSKNHLSKSNPFLYDPINTIEFEFQSDAAQCYTQRKNSNNNPPIDPQPKNYNPGTKALLKYYCALADVKSDVAELQRMVNELANILSDL